MGADDLAPESGIDEVRDSADVIDVGMGEKEVVDLTGLNRELVKGQLRGIAIGRAAIDKDVYAGGCCTRMCL
jgi:hypothetical protein